VHVGRRSPDYPPFLQLPVNEYPPRCSAPLRACLDLLLGPPRWYAPSFFFFECPLIALQSFGHPRIVAFILAVVFFRFLLCFLVELVVRRFPLLFSVVWLSLDLRLSRYLDHP